MNKIWIIIQREYLTRVKKKSFLILTFLVPILIFGAGLLMIYIAMKGEEKQKILVNDESGFFFSKLDKKNKTYSFVEGVPQVNESKKDFVKRNEADIYLHIFPFKSNKPDSILVYKEGGVSLGTSMYLNTQLDNIFQVKQMEDLGIDKSKIDSIQNSTLAIKSYDLKDNKETNSGIASGIGYIMGIAIYLVIFIYGSGVMRGVMEEKTNRIAEVIISSVKPFQLMMGKILGIGLVGLTQFLLWGILIILLQFLLPLLIPSLHDLLQSKNELTMGMQPEQMTAISNSEGIEMVKMIMNQNWGLIIGSFIFYFLGGYFIYASLFAAVGSLVNEDAQEAQQLTLPVTMPIVFGFVILMTTLKEPNSTLSIFGSLFPLTSPIVMMGRIAYGVPISQLILSVVFLIAGFLLITWLSGKIYRTGILLYGKKTTWKEVLKWIRYS